MLVLSRKRDRGIVVDLRKWGLGIGRVIVVEIRGDKTRLGLEFEKEIPVHRTEVFEAIERKLADGLEVKLPGAES